ncbi:MAG: hypothetical protein AAFX06_16880 [Planctomycetota bacterium]
MPLHSDFANGHVDGLRNEVAEAGESCLGETVTGLYVDIATKHGEPLHGVDRSPLELEFASGDVLQASIAHGGEAILFGSPIHPAPTLDDGFATNRVSLNDEEGWSTLIGSTLRRIDVILSPIGNGHHISGFLLGFSNGQTIGFENRAIECIRLELDPDWLRSERNVVAWLGHAEQVPR